MPLFQLCILSMAALSKFFCSSIISFISALAASPCGGGGTGNALPEGITHVFHVPASGSIPCVDWLFTSLHRKSKQVKKRNDFFIVRQFMFK